eukprot:8353994-Ditylum_brightwellii.AAC.1
MEFGRESMECSDPSIIIGQNLSLQQHPIQQWIFVTPTLANLPLQSYNDLLAGIRYTSCESTLENVLASSLRGGEGPGTSDSIASPTTSITEKHNTKRDSQKALTGIK